MPSQEAMPGDASAQPPATLPLADLGEMLEEVEHNLRSAMHVLEQLRADIGASVRPRLQVIQQEQPAPPPQQSRQHLAANGGGSYAPFERLWERLEQERLEKQPPLAEAELRGLDLLPRQYLMTVEDRERTVDLVPLHRALQNLIGVQEVALVSFANGVPVVSVRTDRELGMDKLQGSVEAAMARECEVIPQDNGRVFLRLKPVADRGE